eukprot:4533262-Prymnesium_polylepis.2
MADNLAGSNPSPTVCFSFPGALRGPLHGALMHLPHPDPKMKNVNPLIDTYLVPARAPQGARS